MTDFIGFPKIARLSRGIVVTEKIDGTNAQIRIVDLSIGGQVPSFATIVGDETEPSRWAIWAGSRNQWIWPNAVKIPGQKNPETDNYGFAAWVHANAAELVKLGEGTHFGEWWGAGIQRRYGQTQKRFSLFNSARWADASKRPACCDVVPVLYEGPFDQASIDECIERLTASGSVAAPGFMQPEGIVVYHTAARMLFKKTIDKDGEPKGKTVDRRWHFPQEAVAA